MDIRIEIHRPRNVKVTSFSSFAVVEMENEENEDSARAILFVDTEEQARLIAAALLNDRAALREILAEEPAT